MTRDPDQPPECLRAEARVEATASKWKGSGYAHRGRRRQTNRGSTCSEALPGPNPAETNSTAPATGTEHEALNAGALPLRRRQWAAAPVSRSRVRKQEGNGRHRNRRGPKGTCSSRPGRPGARAAAGTDTPAGGPAPLSFSFLKQKNGTNATSLTDSGCGH